MPIRRQILFLILFLLFSTGTLIGQVHPADKTPFILIDIKENGKDLGNFRKMSDEFTASNETSPSRDGLRQLKASGSAQFSARGLKLLKEALKGEKVVVVDLRQESHGFLNGIPVSWRVERNLANVRKSHEEILQDEKRRLNGALKSGNVKAASRLSKDKKEIEKSLDIAVTDACTESELCAREQIGYKRFFVTDLHRPSDADVDSFIRFTRMIPAGTWLHFHCKAGRGRTTTFLSMYDMMRNSGKVSRPDIIKRQYLMGGPDLFAPEPLDSFEYPSCCERAAFIWRFYDYCRSNRDNFTTPWSKWLASQD